jgi:hypothetical protein
MELAENWIKTKKNIEMILDAAETVLVYFGFDRTVYGSKKILNQGSGDGCKNLDRKERMISEQRLFNGLQFLTRVNVTIDDEL